MSKAVELNDVFFYYNSVPALEHVSFSVGRGELVGIIGPNGGGKTTLLKIILGILSPAKGTVKVFGKSPKEARAKIGYVPQHTTFDRDFPVSVLDVAMMGRLGKRPIGQPFTEEDRSKALSALEKVGMQKYAERQIGHLSGGQIQRVLVARALVAEPELLLLDEPLSSIDPDAQRLFYETLNVLKKDMAIIIVTHDITAASRYINTIACLNVRLFYQGGIVEGIKHLEKTYQCPIELIAHGIPHRVVKKHD